MQFKIGDKVSFLNEAGNGVVTQIISNYRIIVRHENGFEFSYQMDALIPLAEKSNYKIEETKNKKWYEEKENIPKHTSPKKIAKEIWEIDLHIHELLEKSEHLTHHEKLEYQLNYFQKRMDDAIATGIKKIIFIHGIGKGTLRQEMIRSLKNYEGAKYYAAPFREYGNGAMVVELF